jgi:hypothetical protein
MLGGRVVVESRNVLKGNGTAAEQAEQKPVKPSAPAAIMSFALAATGVVLALLVDAGDGFTPRVETLDTLAGLAIGAFVVERLLTFAPPILAYGARGNSKTAAEREERIKKRSADIAFLRVGYGALFGGLFVMLTDLRAVKVLSPEGATETVSAGLDRVITTLAIAGGVAGLASLLGGLNPPATTDPGESGGPASDNSGVRDENLTSGEGTAATRVAKPDTREETAASDESAVVPPPSDAAYVLGIIAVGVAAAVALFGANGKSGLELVAPSEQADGTVGLVVRFGIVILLAGVIQQVVERTVYPFVEAAEHRKIVTGAVSLVLGVIAALLIDLYLLHDIGFFGVGADETINAGLAASSSTERWFDTFLTGVVIAAGTKPLHDLSAGIKKRAEKKGTPGSVTA